MDVALVVSSTTQPSSLTLDAARIACDGKIAGATAASALIEFEIVLLPTAGDAESRRLRRSQEPEKARADSRSLVNAGLVTWRVRSSLADLGLASAAAFKRALDESLTSAVVDGSLEADWGAACGCEFVALSVVVEPSRIYAEPAPKSQFSSSPAISGKGPDNLLVAAALVVVLLLVGVAVCCKCSAQKDTGTKLRATRKMSIYNSDDAKLVANIELSDLKLSDGARRRSSFNDTFRKALKKARSTVGSGGGGGGGGESVESFLEELGLGEFSMRLQQCGVTSIELLGDKDYCGDAQLQREIGMSKMQIRVFRQAVQGRGLSARQPSFEDDGGIAANEAILRAGTQIADADAQAKAGAVTRSFGSTDDDEFDLDAISSAGDNAARLSNYLKKHGHEIPRTKERNHGAEKSPAVPSLHVI